MTQIRKILTCQGRDGRPVSVLPETIIAAMPDEKMIAQTIILVAIGQAQGQFFLNVPHTRFIQLWEAALNGREVLVN